MSRLAVVTQLPLRLPKFKPPKPSARADWSASAICVRAQSILTGPDFGQCPPLVLEEARDVVAWHERHLNAQTARPARRWPFRLPSRGSA